MIADESAAGLEAERIRVVADGTLLVDGVSCELPRASLTALVGPNGAGKSTLLRALAVAVRPREGSVVFDGVDLIGAPRRERARTVAFVEQDAATDTAITVASAVALGRLPYQSFWGDESRESAAIVERALELVGMTSFGSREFASLSGGERQRVMLARALAQQPRLLLLDEPTNHLDPRAQLDALELLARLTREGMTVLAALHDLSLATAYADRVIVLRDGKVVAAGRTEETLTPALIRDVYGVEAVILAHPRTGRPVLSLSPLTT
jgi:iron complex transport system ATP-binding protein